MNVDKKIRDAANELRSLNAVTIIGAGCSFEQGVPLTAQLQSLLWDAFDADEDALEALSTKLGKEKSPAKTLIGDDHFITRLAYEILASSPKARSKFQHSFERLNKERISRPSPAHYVIAELLHRRIIKMVISLNWDTLLETAYHRKYGSILQSDGPWLKKPHGDAANPESEWVLPYQYGNIPEYVVKEVKSIEIERPHVLLIVGYSEGDEEVVSKLIGPLSDRWRVIRIGPDVREKSDIPIGAQEALTKILREIDLNPEVPGWEYVNFDNQHDLGPALAGRGLGPADVEVCTRLPEVDKVKQQLIVTYSAVIVGESGCGKSLVAYQAAYDMMKDGWEVLRLADTTNLEEASVSHVESLPLKTVLIVDNAQSRDQKIVHNLLEKASSTLSVIVVSTDDVPVQWTNIKIASKRAVSVLSEEFRKRQDEILPIVQKFDDRIGEGYLDEHLDNRITEAAKSERPWQFNFVLTGGWRRAEDEIILLRESDRSDLLLASIAAKQIVSLDASVSRDWLERASRIFGKDDIWLSSAFKLLLSNKHIIDEKTIRCPHMRFSVVVLHIVCHDKNDEYWNKLIRMFREALVYETPPLLGINWLLNHLSDAFRRDRFETVVDDITWTKISQRCWSGDSGEERGHAAFVLDGLLDWHPKQFDALNSNSELIGHWIEEVNSNSAAGLAMLLSSLNQKDHILAEKIVDCTNQSVIANNLARASLSEAFSWGWFLVYTNGIASPDWCSKLARELNASALKELFKRGNVEDLESISMLALGIGNLNHNLAFDLVDLSVPTIGRALNEDINKIKDIRHIIYDLLGFPVLSRHWNPLKRQKEVAAHIVDSLYSELIGRSISNSRRRDWILCAELMQLIQVVTPAKADEIVSYVNFNKLDETARGLWDHPPHELTNLIGALAVRDDCEPARSWINEHKGELVELNPIIVAVAPEASATALKSGYRLDLDLGDDQDWYLATMVLRNLSIVDKHAAIQVLSDNCINISEALHLRIDDLEAIPEFLSLMQELAPKILVKIFELINPDVVEKTWADRLRGKANEKQAAAALLDAVISFGPASLVEVAAKLRRRFPISSVLNSTTPN